MNLELSFSWVGLVVFILPMLINVFYVLFPPVGDVSSEKGAVTFAEVVEKVSRIAYLLVLVFLVSKRDLDIRSAWFYLAILFLVLYYVVWIRYFAGGRDVALLGRSFALIPIPLAIFPVLYFLCAAIWMNNIPATVIMIVFGIAHITVSVRSLR